MTRRTKAQLALLGTSLSAAAACFGPRDLTGYESEVPRFGTVLVGVLTTGPGSDPNGYVALLNEGLAQAIDANGSVEFGEVPAGSHDVRLDGVDGTCTVMTTNPLRVLVKPDSLVEVDFDVTCS